MKRERERGRGRRVIAGSAVDCERAVRGDLAEREREKC